MTPITYLSEQPADYAKDVDMAVSLEVLRRVLGDWKTLASDALEVAEAMNETDFKAFRKGLKRERRGQFAGEKWADRFMAILLPEKMFKVSITANEFKVPWGCAYIRLKECGQLP